MSRFGAWCVLILFVLTFCLVHASTSNLPLLTAHVSDCPSFGGSNFLSTSEGKRQLAQYARANCTEVKKEWRIRDRPGNCTVCIGGLGCPWTYTCNRALLAVYFGLNVANPEGSEVKENGDTNPEPRVPSGPEARDNIVDSPDSAPSPPGEKKRIGSPAGKRDDSTENKPSQKVSQSDGNYAPAKQVAGSNKKVNAPTESEGPSRPAEQQGSISEQPLRSIYNTIYSVLLFSL
ncbi:hypothetical protein Tb927.3.600 [Trypanosoma brucei brucei TREU927]|uniref:Uncharacterized protein n=1 Tax=Trypanosoma brucei brucei (strain 927/4 GUTat10.1) TaxID=185431 RepID=Q57TQ6_TRYB2|nr:hypothetical protein Tb927.3.600 [Trypanosoma brucei brucei TREU927]AAX81085.1 hypothetical protein Tb927.3.600 [Trypanosoma brucei]AAZ10097.1 hypothetical protein Tb927.3.600 [Trypanosoma brucei brucei TREU927]